MSLQVIPKLVNESVTSESTWHWVQHCPHCRDTTWHHVQNAVLCLGDLEKTAKEPKLPNSDTSLLPWRQPSWNRLQWLQGCPCRDLQTCFPILEESLLCFLTCWNMEGIHLEVSEHWDSWVLSVLMLLQLAITQRLGRNKLQSLLATNFLRDFSKQVLTATGQHLHWSWLPMLLCKSQILQTVCPTDSFLLHVTFPWKTCWPLQDFWVKTSGYFCVAVTVLGPQVIWP